MQLAMHVPTDRHRRPHMLRIGLRCEYFHGFICDEFYFLLCDRLELFQCFDYGVDVAGLA